MKKAIIIFTLLVGGLFVTAQEQKLDCSQSLDPRTSFGQVLLGCPAANTPNNVAARAIFNAKSGFPPPTIKQCQVDLA